jgi:hypothetical protein
MNPVLFSAYPLSFIMINDYDDFIDHIINYCLNAKIGECDYLVISLKKILECVEQEIENETNDSLVSFNLNDAMDAIKNFVDVNGLDIENTLVFIQ